MSWNDNDTWLWLGFGVFTFVATKCVGFALRDILSLTQIHEETEKQIAAISQETEDVLDTRSLAVLAESHDGATRELAIRILADRFVRDQRAITSLTADLYSRDPERQARGRVLRRMIERYASDTGAIQFLSDFEAAFGQDGSTLPNRRARAALPREHEESFEEQELRRRRREAVVFHDGGGPISQDDIIQRSANGAPFERRRNEAETTLVERALRDVTAGTGLPIFARRLN